MKCFVGKGKSGTGYASWNKDASHRAHAKKLGMFQDIWPENGGPLPWRLTADEKKTVELRMSNVVWPHYVERLYYKGASCWTKPNRMWKARRKYRLLYYMLLTQLRGLLPAVHQGLLYFVWAMRQLQGQAYSFEAAKSLNILPGSPAVRKADCPAINRDLNLGLVMINGSMPVGHLNPGMGHFKHYPRISIKVAIPSITWMMGFERYNKYLKSLIHHPQHPEVNLAKSATRANAANFVSIQSDQMQVSRNPHGCVLSGRESIYLPTCDEVLGLRFAGCDQSTTLAVTESPIAFIMNVHFHAGEWGKRPRCGSVITCRINGVSRYARVHKFIRVDEDPCPGYALVSWFGKPRYSFDHKAPLGVCCELNDCAFDRECGQVIRITQIDPCRVMVEIENDKYWMMRDRGWDTRSI